MGEKDITIINYIHEIDYPRMKNILIGLQGKTFRIVVESNEVTTKQSEYITKLEYILSHHTCPVCGFDSNEYDKAMKKPSSDGNSKDNPAAPPGRRCGNCALYLSGCPCPNSRIHGAKDWCGGWEPIIETPEDPDIKKYHLDERFVTCYICKEKVSLAKARSGDDSKPCHGECLIKEISNKTPKENKLFDSVHVGNHTITPIYTDTDSQFGVSEDYIKQITIKKNDYGCWEWFVENHLGGGNSGPTKSAFDGLKCAVECVSGFKYRVVSDEHIKKLEGESCIICNGPCQYPTSPAHVKVRLEEEKRKELGINCKLCEHNPPTSTKSPCEICLGQYPYGETVGFKNYFKSKQSTFSTGERSGE
jgi:hypothetical protein